MTTLLSLRMHALTDVQWYNINMEDSIFTKILNGDIPGRKLYEDEKCFVLLTHEPLNPGHCLVIPKHQIDSAWDIPDELYSHLMLVVKKMAKKMEAAYDYKRIGMFVEGFGVPHAHIHVFGYTQPLERTIADHMKNKQQIDNQEMERQAEKMSLD